MAGTGHKKILKRTGRTWVVQGLGQHSEALGFYSKFNRKSTKGFKQKNNKISPSF